MVFDDVVELGVQLRGSRGFDVPLHELLKRLAYRGIEDGGGDCGENDPNKRCHHIARYAAQSRPRAKSSDQKMLRRSCSSFFLAVLVVDVRAAPDGASRAV